MPQVQLKPIGQNGKLNRPFITIDIEANRWTNFLCIGTYDGKNFKWWDNLNDCLLYCFQHYSSHNIFSHFGGIYDHIFFYAEALKQRYEIGPAIPRGSGILTFTVTYRAMKGSSGDELDEKKLTFRDSSALFNFGLKRLTESFGVTHTKKELDHSVDHVIDDELLTYLEYDCKGLYESIQKFYNWPIIKRCGGSNTIASQALRVFQSYLKFPLSSLQRSENPKTCLEKKIRKAYLGGRTEIFRPQYRHRSKKLNCYDVNSLFPTVMRANVFPDKFDYETFEYEKNKLGFYEAEVTVPDMYIPPLGVVHNGKFIFPVGKFKGIWTIAELNYAKTLGVKVDVNVGYIFKSAGYLFTEFVDDLYQIKEESEKGTVNYEIAKLLLNSCYGRFGLNLDRENIVIFDGSEGQKPTNRQFTIGNRTYEFATIKKEIEAYSNVAIAAYVTSYARIHMHKIMTSIEDSLYYTDTDSIFTTRKLPVSNELGGLKLEYSCNEACFLLPKTYIAGDLIKMKGFDNKKIQHFTYEDFYQALKGDLKHLKIIQEPKFMRFKSAMRNGGLLTMTKQSTRQIISRYDKREIYVERQSFNTKPIKITQIEVN